MKKTLKLNVKLKKNIHIFSFFFYAHLSLISWISYLNEFKAEDKLSRSSSSSISSNSSSLSQLNDKSGLDIIKEKISSFESSLNINNGPLPGKKRSYFANFKEKPQIFDKKTSFDKRGGKKAKTSGI